ncbi:MAG: FAD-dependent thymidylate synthase [Candidatus Lokiarchaeota archaeon]|nr:FAD-dependent thymidylate synthase [Candidatus Lokiarchaeota archaeon]
MRKVLNKGFVKLVDKMGDDSSIVQAARVSYSKGTKTKREDDKLIHYLLKNHHWTPFEMVVFKFHVKLPIFIARQWMRHRAGTFNEISARYSEMEECFYIPELERIQSQSITNKQGSDGELELSKRKVAYCSFIEVSEFAFKEYQKLLDLGVSRELSRMSLPVNIFTEFYWKVDLRNLFNFLTLRNDSHAQFEIREYSKAILDIISEIVPVAYEAYNKNK